MTPAVTFANKDARQCLLYSHLCPQGTVQQAGPRQVYGPKKACYRISLAQAGTGEPIASIQGLSQLSE